jgi:hypothetical protein
MIASIPPALKSSRWGLPCLLALVAFVLSPLLRTGYFSDDAVDSLLPGMLKVEGYTLAEYIWTVSLNFITGGRLFPLQFAELCTWFYVVQTPVVHKAMVIVCVLLDVTLLYFLVRRVGKNAGFAAFATCLVFPLFQFRTTFDPLLSFFGLLQMITAGLLASLLALQIYLDTNRTRWMVLSVVTYAATILMYEFNYPLFLLHLVLIGSCRRSWAARVRASLPFVVTGGLGILASAALRWLYVRESNQINIDPLAFLATLTRQTLSAFPLSYFLVNPAGLYPHPWNLAWMARFLATPGGVTVCAGVFMACLTCLRHLPAGDDEPPTGRMIPLALLGLLLGVLPAVLISVSVRHQQMIRPGLGYLPVYLQYYGVGLLLAAVVWSLLSRTAPGGVWRRWSRVVMAGLVALTAGVTYRANATLVDRLETPLESPLINPVVAGFWGCWNEHRRNLESALHAGLLDDVPDHALVYLANEYPAFHDRPHSRYFYAMHSGKVIETIPLTARREGGCWFPRKASLQPRSPATPSPPFLLRDVCLGKTAGYVVLSRLAASGRRAPPHPGVAQAGREIRLFVRHPKLFEGGPVPALVLSGARPGTATEIGGTPVSRRGRELTMVRSGPDWAILSLRPEAEDVDPSSLTLAFGAISATWGEGFDPPQVSGDHWWRRGKERGVLTLNNATDAPRQVRISMLLQNRRETPLVLSGGPMHAVVPTGPGSPPVRFEHELTLSPGAHPVVIHAADLPSAPASTDAPSLSFRVIDFNIQDRERR